MAKPAKKKESTTPTYYGIKRRKSKMRPNYCRYCTARLPRGPRKFCNASHEKAFST